MIEKPWNDPIHPAEHLREDFLEPLGLTPEKTADALRVPVEQLISFLEEDAPMTGELALRLERAFGATADYWMGWQSQYELDLARRRDGGELEKITRVQSLIAAE